MMTGGGGVGAQDGLASLAALATSKSPKPLRTPSPPDHCHSRSQAAGSLENHCALAWEPENPDGKSSCACSLVKVHSRGVAELLMPEDPAPGAVPATARGVDARQVRRVIIDVVRESHPGG